MTLQDWLKKNNMTQAEFCKKIGTYRQALRRVYQELNVSAELSEKIRVATDGQVFPTIGKKGRPRIYHELYR